MATLVQRPAIARRGRNLEIFTIAWNSLEGLIAIGAGLVAGSISLVGFGIDSVIECISGAALLWRMGSDAEEGERERVERLTLKIVGVSFLLLAAYVAIEAGTHLWHRHAPRHSTVGIVLAVASLVVMPLLAREKRKVAAALDSAAMNADARQTEFCTYLSGILLGGLLLNSALGWWWADPIAALSMVPMIGHEGIEALRGHRCNDCH